MNIKTYKNSIITKVYNGSIGFSEQAGKDIITRLFSEDVYWLLNEQIAEAEYFFDVNKIPKKLKSGNVIIAQIKENKSDISGMAIFLKRNTSRWIVEHISVNVNQQGMDGTTTYLLLTNEIIKRFQNGIEIK